MDLQYELFRQTNYDLYRDLSLTGYQSTKDYSNEIEPPATSAHDATKKSRPKPTSSYAPPTPTHEPTYSMRYDKLSTNTR
jgi:hypothetical protein